MSSPIPSQEAAGVPDDQGGRMPERRFDLDALRVFATLSLIVYHTARVFDTDPWHVKNDQLVLAADILVTFMNAWFMPLFFLLAGSAAYFSLWRRSGREYVVERVRRLLIPLIAGVVMVIPPQVYIERIGDSPLRQSPAGFTGSFLEFYPRFFTEGIYPAGNLTYNHLWFIAYLFVFSLVLLPCFLFLNGRGREVFLIWTSWLRKGRRVYLLALPLVVIRLALAGISPGPQDILHDAENVLRSMLLMLFGYTLVAEPGMESAVQRNGRLSLGLSLGLTAVIGGLLLTLDWPPAYSGPYFLIHTLWALSTWSWLLTFLWLAKRYLDADRPSLRRWNAIAYPFYILHQTAIVLIAYAVVQWNLSVPAKYAVIAGTSLAATWLLSAAAPYTPVTRFLLGVKGSARRPSHRLRSA